MIGQVQGCERKRHNQDPRDSRGGQVQKSEESFCRVAGKSVSSSLRVFDSMIDWWIFLGLRGIIRMMILL